MGSWFLKCALSALVAGTGFMAFGGAANAVEPVKSCSDCQWIKNKDRKNYCYAKCKNDKSYCQWIKNKDLKNQCKAEVG